jgi:hypothetical protein
LGPEKQFQMFVGLRSSGSWDRVRPARSSRWWDSEAQHLDGGCLPGPVRVEEGENFARLDSKRNTFDGGKIARFWTWIMGTASWKNNAQY